MSIIAWLLIAAASGGYTSPVVVATFSNEGECMKAADDLWVRSNARADTKGMYSARMNGMCLGVRREAIK